MKDFLAIADYSGEDIQEMLDLAVSLKKSILLQVTNLYLKGRFWV